MRALLNWFIALLGGVTQDQHEEELAEMVDTSAQLEKQYNNEVMYLREQLRESQLRYQELLTKVLTLAGVPSDIQAANHSTSEALKPMQGVTEPWNKRKHRLERLDREMASELAKEQLIRSGKGRPLSEVLEEEARSAS